MEFRSSLVPAFYGFFVLRQSHQVTFPHSFIIPLSHFLAVRISFSHPLSLSLNVSLSHSLAVPLSSSPPPVSSSISALAGSAYVLPVPNFTWLSTSTVIFDAKKFGSDATDAFYDRLTSSADLDFEKLTQRTTLSRRWWRQVEINQLSDQSTYVWATLFLYL